MEQNERTRLYSLKLVHRLQQIDAIYDSVIGWTKELANLYQERKILRLETSRMVRRSKKAKKNG